MKNVLGCSVLLGLLGLAGCAYDRDHARYRYDYDRDYVVYRGELDHVVQHEIPYGRPEFGGRPEFERPDYWR